VAVVMSDNPGSPRPDGLLNGVSCVVVQDELHVTVIDGGGSIWHTIRDVNGRFGPFGEVIATVLAQNAGSPNPGTASVVAVADSF
jgi:hypothetical protein